MRIAYMLTSLGVGGAERQVLALAERMNARGHTAVVMALVPQQLAELPAAVETVRLGMKKTPLGILTGLVRAREFLREFKPDLVHSHTFPANLTARMLRLAGAAPAVLSTIHNVYEGGRQRMLAYRLTDPLALHTTAVSKAVADRYLGMRAISRCKCSVLTNGIDTSVFSPSSASGEGRGCGNPTDQFVWLAAGRATAAKDMDNLLRAFRQVREKSSNAQLWIAGQDSGAREMVGSDGEDGIRWLGVRQDMPGVMAMCDAFVLSSAWEGMPLVVGEAMAMERPVVATDVGGVRELVGDAGVMVPAKDPQALAHGMLRIMRMPTEDRRDLGRAARSRIVEQFAMDAKALEWEELYQRLLKSANGRVVGLSADSRTGIDRE